MKRKCPNCGRSLKGENSCTVVMPEVADRVLYWVCDDFTDGCGWGWTALKPDDPLYDTSLQHVALNNSSVPHPRSSVTKGERLI